MNHKSKAPEALVPSSEVDWLGSTNLLPGESPAQYRNLHTRLTREINPNGPIEKIWVRDVIDQTWDILRLRVLKTGLIAVHLPDGIDSVLSKGLSHVERHELSKKWVKGDPAAQKRVNDFLATAGLTMDAVVAETLSIKIDQIERIDHMIMTSEARRNATLREIERHRSALAAAAQRAVREIEDAQFKVVEPEQIEAQKVSDAAMQG